MPAERRNNILIIILLSLIISLVFILGFYISDRKSWNIGKIFQEDEEEYTILLDEFIINLKSEARVKDYLKIEMALMYEEGKDGELLDSNKNKIRDIIIKELRNKTADEMLDVDGTNKLKEVIVEEINLEFEKDLVKDVYFTELVIQ